MIRGETIYVSLVTHGTADRLGNPQRTYAEPVAVSNVVVDPSSSSEQTIERPDGVEVALTLHFPRGYASDLRGAIVTVRGEQYRVLDDPHAYTEGNVRGPWTMPVKVARHDG